MYIETLEKILEEKEKMLNGANRELRRAIKESARALERYNKFAKDTDALKRAINSMKEGK